MVLPRQREGDYVFDICGDLGEICRRGGVVLWIEEKAVAELQARSVSLTNSPWGLCHIIRLV